MTADTVRITYAELARARGVSMAAARRLAQRHRWPKQVGNDGLSHVLVPTIYLVPSENDAGDVTTDVTGDVTTNAAADVPNGVAADSPELRSIPLEEALAAFADVAND